MLWELPIQTGSLEDLAERVKLLSGHQLDLTGAVLPLRPEDLQKTWDGFKKQPPKDFIVSSNEIVQWYLREAEASEGAKPKQWGAAAFHWKCLLEIKPDDETFQDRLNHAQDQLNKSDEAKP